MSVLLVGASGSQGKRYQAILNYLGISYIGIDLPTAPFDEKQVEGVIITTPTDTHIDVIRKYLPLRRPILVEKPIAKDSSQVRQILSEAEQAGVSVSMVLQYQHLLTDPTSTMPSYYNYFNHGQDGLAWDCLQIIGLANGDVEVREDSPVWKSAINGKLLSISDMDHAYIQEIEGWSRFKGQSPDYLVSLHQKVEAYIAKK